jgi:NAD/NADP transhydrogenase alpha subunit
MVKPCNALVIGTGVAGLQALATAKRLGAVTYAADIRPAAAEQAMSLGAKIVDTGVPAEVTPEEVFAQGGEDFRDFIADMAKDGYALAVYKGLTPGTTYDVFLAFTTIYGETKYFREQYTPGAAA